MSCFRQILSGEMHYARIPPEYWEARLRMARAMGLNTVSTYVFWNRHEPEPGRYDFSGENDVAAYVRLAQTVGLDVILRPGPYVCAEWDFGGLPSWLLRDGDVRVRSTDERFLMPVRRWLMRLGEELAPLLSDCGGPIVAVQLENEYGAFGSDSSYLAALRTALERSGFENCPIFTIDQPQDLAAGSLPGVPMATTFAPGDPASHFARLRSLRSDAPLLCGEYWAGWFDHWGEPHAALDDEQQAADFEWMLSQGVSANIYMLHGGTNFGFWNGANSSERAPYQPTTTSYDYCAAIDEAGSPTPKYYAFREAIARASGSAPLLVPQPPDVVAVPEFELKDSAPIASLLRAPLRSPRPLPMEAFGQSFGYVLYRTTLKGPRSGMLELRDVRDYAVVRIDGRTVGHLDRRLNESAISVSIDSDAVLDILVENCGRINYGPDFPFERKGITRTVHLANEEVRDWEIFALPLDDLAPLQFTSGVGEGPAFYRGAFDLGAPADTFLDVRDAGKGAVWVNGRNAGRFWDIGPQRSLYIPAPWLRAGNNEVVLFDLFERSAPPRLRGTDSPIIDR